MLDKSIPYHHIIMKRASGTAIPKVVLPEGFSFVDYVPGDEKDWAEILVSSGEFETPEAALTVFTRDYLPHREKLERRVLFIVSQTGEKVATVTCWSRDCCDRRNPSLEWVAVKPAWQGYNLEAPLVFRAMKRMVCLEGDNPIYLHTQTWSNQTLSIYKQAGFNYLAEGSFGGYPNEYVQAMQVLTRLPQK